MKYTKILKCVRYRSVFSEEYGLKAMEELANLEAERGNPAAVIAPAIVATCFVRRWELCFTR